MADIRVELETAHRKSQEQLSELLNEFEKLGITIGELEIDLSQVKGLQLKEKGAIDKIKEALNQLVEQLNNQQSQINKAIKILEFNKKIARENTEQEVFRQFLAEVKKRYRIDSGEVIRQYLNEACENFHKLIRAEITVDAKITGNLEKISNMVQEIQTKIEAL